MAGFLKKLFSNPVTNPAGYAYKKLKEKKAEDKAQKSQVAKGQKMAEKKEKMAAETFKMGQKGLEQTLAGKGAPPSDLGEIMKRFQRAGQGAEQFFQPIQDRAVRDFNQQTAPQIVSQYGQGAKSSSALNQALSAAAGNLSENIASNLATMKQNQATNLLNMSQNSKLSNFNNRLAASQSAIGQPSAYQPNTQAPLSMLQQYGPLAAGGIGAVLGGIGGGPAGALAGFQGGTSIGQTVFR